MTTEPRERRFPRMRRFASSFSAPGLVFALVFFCASMTPSLVPRDWIVQTLISGFSVVSGYGIGVFVAWFVRKLGWHAQWSATIQRSGWIALLLAYIVLVPLFLVLGRHWQIELSELFGLTTTTPSMYPLVVLFAVLLFLIILSIARGLRGGARWVGRFLGRWIPGWAARISGTVVVAVLAVLIFNGAVLRAGMDVLDSIYAGVDKQTEVGVTRPSEPERSGSSASNVTWDSLGSQGRTFVSGGPRQAELAEFMAKTEQPRKVKQPIRAYAGRSTSLGLNGVAAEVVAELHRTDAWSREVLVVVTTTGTGWVDPSMSDSMELLYGGDCAIAAMQYSYLPSWISFVSDRETPPAAGKTLFEAVYSAWSKQPAESRPRLLAFGESLGSYGSQGAFSGHQDMATRTDGALWIGTPNFTPNWSTFTANREPGTLEYDPTYRAGISIRWGTDANSAADMWDLEGPWSHPRFVYVQHPSDAVVWWSPDLILREPDWLSDPRGEDVLDSFHWIPVVTFFQVTTDLFFAADAPEGHGHNYHLEYVDGWTAIAPPKGWTEHDTEVLRATMAERPSVT